jgi:hypothetical protein
MTEILTKVIVDCSTGESIQVPLTEDELAQREIDRLAYEQEESDRINEENRIAAIKTSARAKLVAGEPLTEEEASLIIL